MSKKKKVIEAEELIPTEEQTAIAEAESTEEVPEEKVGFLKKLGQGIKARGPKIVGVGAGVVALVGGAIMLWNKQQEDRNLMALEVLRADRDEDGDEEGEDDAESSETAESETEE